MTIINSYYKRFSHAVNGALFSQNQSFLIGPADRLSTESLCSLIKYPESAPTSELPDGMDRVDS
jgi:hypothetical protein